MQEYCKQVQNRAADRAGPGVRLGVQKNHWRLLSQGGENMAGICSLGLYSARRCPGAELYNTGQSGQAPALEEVTC